MRKLRRDSRSSASSADRRTFLKSGLAAGVAGAGLVFTEGRSAAREDDNDRRLTKGDAAMLRFAAAAEILESDFWVQYNELGGIQDDEVPGGSGNPTYTAALQVLDSDFPIYIHDNTDDEITHFTFLNAYLESKGAAPANLDKFRTLQGSRATGSSGKPRLTNLMELTLDTSWWTRYRSSDNNPDLGSSFPVPPSRAGPVQGAAYGDPQKRRRPVATPPYPGHR